MYVCMYVFDRLSTAMRARCERWSLLQKSQLSSMEPLPLPVMTWQAALFCPGNSRHIHTVHTSITLTYITVVLRFSFQSEKKHSSTVHLIAIARLYREITWRRFQSETFPERVRLVRDHMGLHVYRHVCTYVCMYSFMILQPCLLLWSYHCVF